MSIFNFKIDRILVLKDATLLSPMSFAKFQLVKAGTISYEYSYGNFHFLDENNEMCFQNYEVIMDNPEYFMRITDRELRKMKIKCIENQHGEK